MTEPFDSEDLASLGAKLDILDLSAGEAAALDALIATAIPDPEVEGFGGEVHGVHGSAAGNGGYKDRLAGGFGSLNVSGTTTGPMGGRSGS